MKISAHNEFKDIAALEDGGILRRGPTGRLFLGFEARWTFVFFPGNFTFF
jgi:hypothetical protein